ncbi:MAG: glycosyltransferase [Tepidisphaeraceae bacterium]
MDQVELHSFPVYITLGPVAWALLVVGLCLGKWRMGKLKRPPVKLPQPVPSVTVIIPAKDEGERIRLCLESVLKLQYPVFSVIGVNDRSNDDTGRVMDEVARQDARLQVIHIPQGGLPPGWLGKCHALHTAARHATGKWLLFVDSDVKLEPDVLSATLALAEARVYDAVSILTRLECNTMWERLILPLAAGAWSIMHTISLTNSDRRRNIAAANGQFFLVRRAVYEDVGGHETVKDLITEDVELMRAIKAKEGTAYKTRFFMGRDFASTRMYSEMRSMFNGFGRIFSGTARRRPWRIIAAMLFLITGAYSAYAALAWGAYRTLVPSDVEHTWGWLLMGGVHLALMSACLAVVYRWSGNRARWALAFPVGGAALMAVFGFALVKCFTGRTSWRGTTYGGAPQDVATISPQMGHR